MLFLDVITGLFALYLITQYLLFYMFPKTFGSTNWLFKKTEKVDTKDAVETSDDDLSGKIKKLSNEKKTFDNKATVVKKQTAAELAKIKALNDAANDLINN